MDFIFTYQMVCSGRNIGDYSFIIISLEGKENSRTSTILNIWRDPGALVYGWLISIIVKYFF